MSFRQILKSSALIGGSSVINLGFSIIRSKCLAILIGTSGVGLFGTFNSIVVLVGGVAGMGINASGVRQIAEAVGSGDTISVGRVVWTLRITARILGFAGMLLLIALSIPIARVTFGDTALAGSIAIIAVTVLFAEIAAGQRAIVQGMRRIRDLAALSITEAAIATIIGIPIIYWLRGRGIVPFIVLMSAATVATSWWFARRAAIRPVPLARAEFVKQSRGLLRMGIAFMVATMMAGAVAYAVRVLVIRELGLQAAGLFQAGWTLSGVYVGFILNAMSSDYYPRLTAVANNVTAVNDMVNEQTEAAVLMATPGVVATLAFAPWIVHILYSNEFSGAAGLLQWQLLGVFGRVVTWPIGFVLLAKGWAKTFFWTEFVSNIAYIAFAWIGLKLFGLDGVGIAFAGFYVFYGLVLILAVWPAAGLKWRRETIGTVTLATISVTCVFAIERTIVIPGAQFGLGLCATILTTVYCARRLMLRAGCPDLRSLLRGPFNRSFSKSV